MKYLILIFLLGLQTVIQLHAWEKKSHSRADSIMQQVIGQAELYEDIIDSYEAETYTKGGTKILKKNWLIRFAYLVFPVSRNLKDAVLEMNGVTQYDAPNHYRNKVEAVNSNHLSSGKQYKDIYTFINLNIYSPTIYSKEIIMPISPEAFKYYSFSLEEIQDTCGLTIYNIRFTPKQWSQKLLSGNLYITDKLWTIDRIDIQGHSSFSEFRLRMRFSREENRFILPEKANLQVRFKALGNIIDSYYHTSFRYRSVAWVEEDNNNTKQHQLDQTSYYYLANDTVAVVEDTAYWNTKRDEPLTADERLIYYENKKDSIQSSSDSTIFSRYLKLGEQLTNTVNLDYNTTRVKYSGLLNPFQLAFGSNGVTYNQQIRISKTFAHDKQLRFHPEIGFIFKKKEVRFKITTDWEYLPQRLGVLSFTMANNNQGYSSDIMKTINEALKDSSLNFDDLHLKYFHHYNFNLQNKIEVLNGLQISTEITYHHRTPVKNDDETNIGSNIIELTNKKYNDFTPVIGITFTPRQHYWMDRYRKEYLYSHYPTFTTEIACAIPGIMKSTSQYWRFEAGMHQSIKIGLSQRLSYNFSGGLFFNQHNTYFADFRYFAKRYFPEPWGDRFGGVFHNLNGNWYNASDKYIQGHLMYESPLILLHFIKPKTHKYIVSERLYLSQLWTPVLHNYSELGYGIGSDLFNAAFFLSFSKFKYQTIGIKFALELFR